MLSTRGLWMLKMRAMSSEQENNESMEEKAMARCDVCTCDVEEEHLKHVTVKGKIKKICEQCVTAIKGLS
jgi:hypothetical protein